VTSADTRAVKDQVHIRERTRGYVGHVAQ